MLRGRGLPGLLLEPPRPGLPGRARLAILTAPLRTSLLAAALVLAVASRGDVLVLALALGLAAGRWPTGIAVTGALAAAMLRWGTPSLGAIAGAQAVLGPAGWTGRGWAVASAWLGASALVLGAAHADRAFGRARTVLAAGAYGAAAAVVVAGPAPGGALGVRIGATALLVAVALAASITSNRVTRALGAVLGLAALFAAGASA